MGVDLGKLSGEIKPVGNGVDLSKLNANLQTPTDKEQKYITPSYAPNLGEHNINVDDYSYYTPTGIFDNKALDETRAQNQGRLAKLGSGLINTISGTALDLIGDVGYLLDTENYTNFKKSSEEGFNNWLSDWTQKAKEDSKLPIYRTKASEGFSPTSAGWWGDNMPTMASTVSMVFPAEGAVMGLSKLGEVLGGAKVIKGIEAATGIKELSGTLKGITGAVVSRHMESLMEGGQTFQDTYQKAKTAGKSDEEAKKIAGEAAANNYQLNWVAMVQDLPEYMLLHKTFKSSSSAFSKAGAMEALKIAGIEGSEEAYQYVTDKEASRKALINGNALKDDNSTFTDRMLDYAKDGDFWTSTFLGAIGGAGFGAYGVHKNNKDQQAYDAILEAHKGILTGDKDTYNRGVDNSFNDLVVSKVADGTTEGLKSGLQFLLSNPERIKDEDRLEVTTKLNQKLKDVEYAESIGKTIINDPTLSPELKKLNFVTQLNQKSSENRLQDINKEVINLQSKDISTLELPADISAYKQAKLTLEGIKNVPNLKGKAKELETNVKQISQELVKAYPEFKTVDDLNKHIISSNDSELTKLLTNREIEKNTIESSKTILHGLKSDAGKKDLQDLVDIVKNRKEDVVSSDVAKQQQERKSLFDDGTEETKQPIEETPTKFTNDTDEQLTSRIKSLSEGKQDSESEAFLGEAQKELKIRGDKFLPTIDKASNPKELDKIVDQIDFKGLMSPALVDKIASKRESLKTETVVTTTKNNVFDESREANNAYSRVIDALYDLQGKLAQNIWKTNGGEDNDKKGPEQRYFRFLEKNDLPEGTKLQIVTRKNNKDLFDKLFDKDAKEYEDEYKIETIYSVFVDKNNNPIYTKQDGSILSEGKDSNLVYATLLTEVGVDSTGIVDKEAAKKELNDFRTQLLESTEPIYLAVNGKSKGIRIREKNANGSRKFNPVQGYITNNINKTGLLELPTIVIGDNNETELSNGQTATARKLYAKSDTTGEFIDLFARNLTNDEAIVITVLIAQRMGLAPKSVENVSDELDKLIYFGVPKDGPKEYTLGVKDDLLYIGEKTFTKEQLATEEAATYLENFLLNFKYANASSKFDFNGEFNEPVFNDTTGGIEYKKWNSYQEFLLSNKDGRSPLFGTDVPAIGEPKFRNYYATYEPSILSGNIKISEDEIKSDKTSSESTNTEVKIENKPKTDTKVFKKRGTGTGKINLDRLESVLRNPTKELGQEEKDWFKTQFPSIPVEDVKGLIDNNSFGRFISSGKVLLSDLAPENTLRHEAFHVVTQLYLDTKQIQSLYSETRNRFRNKQLSDLEVEEILAEDFANYKDTGTVLGGREETKSIFRKLVDFIKKLVGLNNTQIRDIYNNIETGKYLGKQIVGNGQFRTLDKSLPGKTEEFTKSTLDGVDYEFFNVLFKSDFTPEKLFQVTDLSNKIYNEVFDSFIKNFELAQEVGNSQGIKNFGYILENWDIKGGVLDLHNARVKSLGISLTKGENEKTGEVEPGHELIEDPNLITEKSIVEDEDEDYDSSDPSWRPANAISTKDIMFKQTKLFIRTLPKIKSNGDLELNDLGLAQLVDFNTTYNFLLRNLAGVSDFPSMVTKLKELSKNKPEFKILLERLGTSSDTLSFDQILFQNQFRQDFDKNQAVSYKTMLKADGTIYLIDATRENTSGKVKEIWRNRLPILININEEGRLVTTAEDLKSKDNIQFLSKLGINFSEETLPALENNEKFSNAVLGLKQYIAKNKYDLTDLYNEKSDAKGNLNTIVDLEAKYTPDVTELSFISTEGKTVYSISLNNALSIIKNIINNSKTKSELFAKLPHLDTVYTKNSLWLKSMFDLNGDKRIGVDINLDLLDGLATQDLTDKVQKQTTKLSKGDKLVQELNNLLLDGKTAYIRASDKSTEHSLTLSSYGKNEKLPVSIASLKDGVDTIKLKDIFRGYFKDELQSIVESALFDKGKDLDAYRDITEWNKDNTSVKIKWRLFSDFPNSDEIKAAVKSKIEELKKVDLSDQEKQDQIEELFNSLKEGIDKITVEFFDKYTKELVKEYESVGITQENKLGISRELTDKYSFDQIMRALAVNDFINSVEQVKLFIGDLAFYKDLFKRTSAFTGTKKTARVDNEINTWLNINSKRKDEKEADGKINVFVYQDSNQSSDYLSSYVDSLLNSGLTKEQAETILHAYSDMDEADAQGYIVLDEYREFFIRTGDWKAEHQRIFNKSQNGETLTSDEIFYFMTLKAQYSGPQDYNGIYAPAYHKYSLMPLIPQMVKGTNLEKLLNIMTDKKNQVGYAVFKSGSKVGTKVDEKGKANRFYTNINNGEVNSENLLKQTIDYKFLGIQLDIAPKLKKEVIFGTQFRKLLFSNLFEGGKEIMSNAQSLFDEYTGIFDKLINIEKNKLVKELGINSETYKQEDVQKLVDLLKEEAKGRNLADNIIDALQTEKMIDGKIMLKYNFDSMVNKEKIDSMIMSLVNSRLIRQMMNGDAMIQGASTGFEKAGRRAEGSNDLKFYTKEKPWMEVKVPLTGEYRSLLDTYKTIDEINKALKEGKIDTNLISLVGYRIPTQGLNSIENMRIQEFLPESSGNLIILPTEIVAKSGGDYDIDKMNIFRPWLNPKDDTQKLQNRIIDISKEILEHEYNFNALITPNSTKILTSVVDELRFIEFKEKHPDTKLTVKEYNKKYSDELKNIRYTNQLKLTTKVDQFSKFLGGKAGVGIGALQNTHHILSQIANLNLNRSYKNEKDENVYVTIYFPHNTIEDRLALTKNIDLSKLKDVKGNNNISEVISQVINASVDIAKDPFMFDLNMNLETLSTYLYLVRTGVEFEQVAYFMKQPIITEFLNESSKNKSVFLKVSGKAKSDSKIIKEMTTTYEKKLQEKLGIKSQEEFLEYMAEIKPRYDITKDELKSYLSKDNQDSVAYLHAQIQLLANYKDYKKQASLLSEAINSVNHDTAGLGASINASRNKLEQKEKVKKTNFINNIENIYKNTFVGKFDQHQFTIDAYSQFYSTQKGDIIKNNRNLLHNLTSEFTKEKDRNKLNTLIDNDFINYVVQNYGYEQNISSIITNLFKGDHSVAKEILRLRTAKDLTSDELKLSQNLLIKELYPLLADKNHLTTDNVKIYAKRFDTFTSNQLTQSFREIEDKNPTLAKDLMDLGILQSGLNNSAITFMGIIPFEYYGDLVKHAFENFDKKNGAQELTKFNQLFIRNNSNNPVFWTKAFRFFLRENPKNALGDGMYGKLYDLKLYNENLPTVELEEEPKEDILDESTQIEDYSPEILDNSEDNAKDYPEDLDNSENVPTFDDKKPSAPIRVDSLSNFKKEVGLKRSEIAGENRAKILGKLKKFNTDNSTNYSVQFKRLGESTLYTFTISGGPVVEQEELDFSTKVEPFTWTEQQYNDIKQDIEDSLHNDEMKKELLADLNKVDSEESLAELIKKFCK